MPETAKTKDKNAYPTPTTAVPARRFGAFHFSTAQFLGALVLLFLGSPLVMQFRNGDLLEAVLFTVVVLSGVLAAGGRRVTLIVAAVLVAPAVVGKWINHFRPDLCPTSFFQGALLVFFIFLVVHLLRFIFRAPRVNSEVLCAAVSAYMLLGLLWMSAYLLVARIVPNSFAFTTGPAANQTMEGLTAFYFSFVTLCTVGFGDIAPVSSVARMLAVMEAMTGTFYMTLLIARLVAVYSSSGPAAGESDRAARADRTTEPTPTKPEP
jgi:voltage-gated potassium channel